MQMQIELSLNQLQAMGQGKFTSSISEFFQTLSGCVYHQFYATTLYSVAAFT